MSNVVVKMKMSPAQAGALYMKSIRQEDRIKELESMLAKKLDLVRCGIGGNYSGNPYEYELYTEVVNLLNT